MATSSTTTTGRRTAYRTCSFCEATCGLEITLEGEEVVAVRGDEADVFSQGFACAKGLSVRELHHDPDRLRAPLVRQPDGSHREVTWDEAFAEVDRLLGGVIREHGPGAVAGYVGNPMGHTLAGTLYLRAFYKPLGRPTLFTVGTVDQHPKSLACALLFGHQYTVPVPDIDRTSHLLVIGANPLVSNGSLLAAPDIRSRIQGVRQRGGKVVVVDPRRTETARSADEHHFIRPGADALFLAALAHTLLEEGLAAPGRLEALVDGLDDVRDFVAAFPPERVAGACRIPAVEIRRLARELAAAPAAAVYGRIGTTTQAFGTTASWLVEVLNVLTGNLDRPGGAMLTSPAAGGPTYQGTPGRGRGIQVGRWHSRVRGAPEVLGELPLACLAEEIETPGEGRIRALVTFSGNPALSNPDPDRLETALRSLECLVCVDLYLNETTRLAHVILPSPSPLERAHYDVMVYPTALRNIANYSPPVVPLAPGRPDEWEIVLRLAGIVSGLGPAADVAALDAQLVRDLVARSARSEGSPIEGRDPDEVIAALGEEPGPERLLDASLRLGPYGDGFGSRPGGLTLDALRAAPHGIDFGPLVPRLPEALRTPSGKVELGHPVFLADRERLEASIDGLEHDGLVLIGRRDVRSMNSWMHNLPSLARGRDRCTVVVHPDDAVARGLVDGGRAVVRSEAGSIAVGVEVSDEVMPGVVSVPHGFGHGAPGARLGVAGEVGGANVNALVGTGLLDPLSGTSVLTGFAVDVAPA